MKHTVTAALVSAAISLIVGAATATFASRIVTENRLARLEATVETVRDDVTIIKRHLLGDSHVGIPSFNRYPDRAARPDSVDGQ